eukprot:4723316-Pyramimonas_sp.AAC.1
MQEAQSLGAKLVHGDRDINDTMRRLQASFSSVNFGELLAMSAHPPIKLDGPDLSGVSSMEELIESIKTREKARELMHAMERVAPQMVQTLSNGPLRPYQAILSLENSILLPII